MTPYPGVPWLHYRPSPRGGYDVVDTRDGQHYHAACPDCLKQLVADLSGSQTHYGLGDMVHSVAKALGFRRCSGCAQRQVAMNRMAPRVMRRR